MPQRTNEQAQAFLEEIHHDVYTAFAVQNMTVEEIAKILNLSPEMIMRMIQTYQERIAQNEP